MSKSTCSTCNTWSKGVIKEERDGCKNNVLCNKIIHGFSIPYTGVQRQTGKERGRFMNGQQGSDVVPGTGRDMLKAEGGGVVRGFLGGKEVVECWERRGVEDGWMKG